jgi:hypothetical protein
MNFLESLQDFHCALEICYLRTGLKIHLEPDAFYKLMLEVQDKSQTAPISEREYNTKEFKLATPAGYLVVVKDETLRAEGTAHQSF